MVEGNNEETVHHAVSFAAQSTYLGLPQMKAYNSINIRLQFRTFEQNGLLFYNAGKASDFIALELVNGRLNYVLNLGYGPISIKDNTSDMVSDINERGVNMLHRIYNCSKADRNCSGALQRNFFADNWKGFIAFC